MLFPRQLAFIVLLATPLLLRAGASASSPAAVDHGAAVIESTGNANAAVAAVSFGLDTAVAQWSKGDKTAALATLMATDWTKPVSDTSLLALSEAKYVMRSSQGRQRLDGELTPVIDNLRALLRHALDTAKADAQSDRTKARKMLVVIKECAQYLNRPHGLAILGAVGKGCEKAADAEPQKLDNESTGNKK
jgi:hypothetical protein